MVTQSRNKTEIKKPNLLLVEGADAKFFCIWALEAYGVEEVQVMDFGGITELNGYLTTLSLLPGYDKVMAIVIARDAEENPKTAISSIQKALQVNGLPVPAGPFEFDGNTPRVAFMLFPGFNEKRQLTAGTLEDLCLAILKNQNQPRLACVKAYLACLEAQGQALQWQHKSLLHTYFAGENRFVGMKIGEASKAGAWNWEHERLQLFKNTLVSLS